MFGQMKKPLKGLTMWDEVAQSVPRTDTPTGRAARARRAVARGWIWASLVVAPVALVVATLALGTLLNTQSAGQGPAVSSQQLQTTPGQGQARVSLNDWLSSQGPAGGEIISWESAQTLPALNGDGVLAYAHTFSVSTDGLGVVWLTQTVFVDDASGAISAAGFAPSMETAPTQEVGADISGWVRYEQATLPGVESAASSWAQAWASGDSEGLRVVMRDGNTDHVYPTVSGVVSVQTRVLTVGQYVAEDDEKVPEGVADTALARVEVTVVWDESATPADADAGAAEEAADAPVEGEEPAAPVEVPADAAPVEGEGEGTTFTVDLRLTEVTGGTPTVTAWGPAGTGPSLTNHQNAYVAREG